MWMRGVLCMDERCAGGEYVRGGGTDEMLNSCYGDEL